MNSRFSSGDYVTCVDPRTWPFLENGGRYVVGHAHLAGGWIKLNGQPSTLLYDDYEDMSYIVEWLPEDMFELEET